MLGSKRLLERTTLNLCLLVNSKDDPKENWEELVGSWEQWPQYYKNLGPGFLSVAHLGHQQPNIWQLLFQNEHVTEFSGQGEGPIFLLSLKSSYRHRGLADYWGFQTKGRKLRAAIMWQSYKSHGATSCLGCHLWRVQSVNGLCLCESRGGREKGGQLLG